jgi:hypothetical protein
MATPFQLNLPPLKLPKVPYSPEELARTNAASNRMSVGDFTNTFGPVVPNSNALPPGVVTAETLAPSRYDPKFPNNPLRSWYSDYLANQAGYRSGNIPEPIGPVLATQAPRPFNPGNIRGFVGFNRDGSRVAPGPNPGAPAPSGPVNPAVKANPFFAGSPWQTGKQNDKPYWMRGFPSYGRS